MERHDVSQGAGPDSIGYQCHTKGRRGHSRAVGESQSERFGEAGSSSNSGLLPPLANDQESLEQIGDVYNGFLIQCGKRKKRKDRTDVADV